ncbi:MAG: leucyl/phenylalanyl-tRNA--protein transferase [Alphaproteobacteria bacterium]|nr:leucyl/phenylalanyl-tRNA--protein transferase [Alphaproteobacteria bacterium]
MSRTRRPSRPETISVASLIKAYSYGVFPMAETRDDPEIIWIDPEWRGILPLDDFHVPKRLARSVRATHLDVVVDKAFDKVIAACAKPGRGRAKTWINDTIERSYIELHRQGHAHSVEVYNGDALVGGLYGVSIGAAFFGESMFSVERDASKIALVHLVARLKAGKYKLLDTQFVTEHLSQFGAIEIPRGQYHDRLRPAIDAKANFYELGGAGAAVSGGTVLQLITQMS